MKFMVVGVNVNPRTKLKTAEFVLYAGDTLIDAVRIYGQFRPGEIYSEVYLVRTDVLDQKGE